MLKFIAFRSILILIPAAAAILGLALASYWSVPPFPLHMTESIIAYDPEIGFVQKPNLAATFADDSGLTYHVFTDRRGVRVSEPGEQSPDQVDLLFVGDSFTWGHGVENDDTFAALVARRLQLASANIALASYGTTQALQMLRRNLVRHPRTVIYPVISDHWRRNVSACAPTYYPFCLDVSYVAAGDSGPEIRLPRTNGVRRTALQLEYEKHGLRPMQWLAHGADVVRGRLLYGASKAVAADAALQRAAMRYLLSEMARSAKAAGAALIVIFIPSVGESAAPAKLVNLSAEIGLRFLDSSTAMRGTGVNPYLPDGHPNANGHRAIAQAIINFLSP